MRRILTSAAVVVFAGFAVAGCGDDDAGGGSDASGDDSTSTTVGTGVETIRIVATNFAFDKTELTATAGEPVTFVLQNDADGTEHNLTIEGLDVDKDAEGGESAEQTVSPEAGTYDYQCEYHPASMKGTLTVT